MRLSTSRWLLAGALLVAVAVVALLVVRPWSSEQPSSDWSEEPGTLEALLEASLWIRPGDGLHDQRLTTLDELHAKYPLPVELPQMMPDGYRLIAVYLIETGHRANPSGPNWLRAQYSTGENTSEIYFNQQIIGDNVDPLEGGEETRVDGARAFSGTRTEPPYDWLRWSRCGRLFELQSAPGQFSSADRIRIAESVGHEGC